jgi:hypothetical protein
VEREPGDLRGVCSSSSSSSRLSVEKSAASCSLLKQQTKPAQLMCQNLVSYYEEKFFKMMYTKTSTL